MTPRKLPLIPERIRQIPPQGWSWIDRRFLHEHATALEAEAITLYFFLAAVSDRFGLSYWSESTIATRLKIDELAITRAREQLIVHDLLAYRYPLYQVLSLPGTEPRPARSSSEPRSLGEILRTWPHDTSCEDLQPPRRQP